MKFERLCHRDRLGQRESVERTFSKISQNSEDGASKKGEKKSLLPGCFRPTKITGKSRNHEGNSEAQAPTNYNTVTNVTNVINVNASDLREFRP